MLGSNLALLKTSESCACFLSAHPSGPGGNPKGIKGVDVRWCKTTGFGTSQFNTIYCYFNGKNGNRNETDIFNHQILWCTILRQTQCISRQTQTNPTHPTNSWHLTSGLLTTFFILRPERVGIHHCLWTKNENSQFRLCFCPHTQAAQIDIKSSCLFLVISVTSSYSLFYPGSLSTSSGPSIWPFLPVASHYMASFVSEAIHLQLEQHWLPKDLFELLRQGLQLLFQNNIFAQLGLDTTAVHDVQGLGKAEVVPLLFKWSYIFQWFIGQIGQSFN